MKPKEKHDDGLREILELKIANAVEKLACLKELLSERDRLYTASTAAALAVAKEAVTKAEAANEKRFEAMHTVSDQQLLQKGRVQEVSWFWGVLVAVIGIAIGVVTTIALFHH